MLRHDPRIDDLISGDYEDNLTNSFIIEAYRRGLSDAGVARATMEGFHWGLEGLNKSAPQIEMEEAELAHIKVGR